MAGDGGVEGDARGLPAEVGDEALIAIGAGRSVGGVAEIELVVGGELELEDVGAGFAVDLVEIFGPGVAALELKAVRQLPADTGLQRVVVGDENGVGEERALAQTLPGQASGCIGDGVGGLAIDGVLGAGEEGLVEFNLAGAMRGLRADIADVEDIAAAERNLDVEVVFLGAAVEHVGVRALDERG